MEFKLGGAGLGGAGGFSPAVAVVLIPALGIWATLEITGPLATPVFPETEFIFGLGFLLGFFGGVPNNWPCLGAFGLEGLGGIFFPWLESVTNFAGVIGPSMVVFAREGVV